MSMLNNKTQDLWRSFMPRRKEINNRVSDELFSVQVFDHLSDLNPINQNTEFEKWAAVEVEDFQQVPDLMETLILPGGWYAVFLHQGGPSKGPESFQYIYGTWLTRSDYTLGDRPHFEVLGNKYKNDDPDSEEEIWIPVQPKTLKYEGTG